MKALRLLMIAGLVVGIAAPAAIATCVPAKTFSSFSGAGGVTPIILDPSSCWLTGCNTTGGVLGRWFDSAALGTNNFAAATTTCNFTGAGPSNVLINAGAQAIVVNGAVGSTNCNGVSGCPGTPATSGDLVLLLEDESSGTNSYFTLLNIDEVTGAYDYTVLAPQIPQMPFPRPRALNSNRNGGPSGQRVTIEWDLPSANANFLGATAPNSMTALPATSRISAYNLYRFVGASAPSGRNVAADGWTLVQSVAYDGNPGNLPSFNVPCDDTNMNEYYAIGFEVSGSVDTAFVGTWTEVECDPTLATPKPNDPRPVREPVKRDSSRTRKGGR